MSSKTRGEPTARLDERRRKAIERATTFAFDREEVTASVVVVTYGADRDELVDTFDALSRQTCDEFEVVVVDNGAGCDVESILDGRPEARYYLRLRENFGSTFARNLGSELAAGDVLIFLDDDGVPMPDFVEQHVSIHERRDVVAVRGRIVPKNSTAFNEKGDHYDLGDETKPWYVNAEGNSSFDAEAFRNCSGFSEGLTGRAGHEGLALTYELVQSGFRRDQILYYPDAVIAHDYASGVRDYLRKRLGHERARHQLDELYPGLEEFVQYYHGDGTADGLDVPGVVGRLPTMIADLLVAGWTRWRTVSRRIWR